MADNYFELHRKLSEAMQADARRVGILKHPTAKGDGREDILCNFLRERIGTMFGVSKAEVVDAKGATTGEFDGAIYDQSVAASLHADGPRRVVRVESLAATIEVKSKLVWADVDDFLNQNKGLINLTRYYEPATILQIALNGMSAEKRDAAHAMFRDGLSPFSSFEEIPAVVSAFFAFDGPEVETAASYLAAPGVDIICVLGKYTLARPNLGASLNMGTPVLNGDGADALGGFVHVLETALQKFRASRSFVWPNSAVYYRPHGVSKP